ncbi:MAG TPA: DUF4259 domain-containing protein [Galbitalea sp.]|nr:DUF4259 domain-containing protein [Galbitalea sp.]
MGAWSGEPFGNDTAADWLWELDDSSDWDVVRAALDEALEPVDGVDADIASTAIAAAEVVARGLRHSPVTGAQASADEDDSDDEDDEDADDDDDSDESITEFLKRAGDPSAEVVQLALSALDAATGGASELTELWAESGDTEWAQANAKLRANLGG